MAAENKTLEEKMTEEKAAAEREQLNALINQLRIKWRNEHGGDLGDQKITAEQEEEFTREAKAQLATKAAEAQARAAADAAAHAALTGPEKALKGAMSKVGEAFKGGPFAFIGTALEALSGLLIKLMPALKSLFPMLQNLAPMFNPSAAGHEEPPEPTPMDAVKNLVSEEKFDEANELLKQEEKKLFEEMNETLAGCNDKLEQEAQAAAQQTLTKYFRRLQELEDEKLLGDASPAYKIANLNARIQCFKTCLSQSREILDLHANRVDIDKKIVQDAKKIRELEEKIAADGDELEKPRLKKSLEDVQKDLKILNAKHEELIAREEISLRKLPLVFQDIRVTLDAQHKPVLEAEQERQQREREAPH